jgi:predicted AlkP superfamily pyrophosphatase or phosphodiesterase
MGPRYHGSTMRRRLTLLVIIVLLGLLAPAGTQGQGSVPPPLLLVISIDGLSPDQVLGADARGARIPNLRRVLQEGVHAAGVVGVIPTTTYPSHTTLVTGVWPARHGVLANRTFDPLRKNQAGWYWYAEDIRVPTLWDAATRAGLVTASMQWPATVGARITWNIPEYWRAGTLDDAKLLRAASTPGLLGDLERELGPYPRALDIEADEGRARFAARLLETRRPSLFTLHLIALDHAQHETGPGSPEALAVLERLDAVIGHLRATAERLSPGRAWLAIVSDHGFVPVTRRLNLLPAVHAAGLVMTDGKGKITDWTAIPWNSGGAAAIVLKDPTDRVTLAAVRGVLDRLASDPANGIDRILEADQLHGGGGFPTASFLVGLKPGWEMGSSLSGPTVSTRTPGGAHGHLPDRPELHASFFLVGPGVPAGRALGIVDMRDIAPTLARLLGLALPSAEGKILLP